MARSIPLGLGDLGIEGEVEVLEGLVVLEAGAAQALVELLAVTVLDLVGQEPCRR